MRGGAYERIGRPPHAMQKPAPQIFADWHPCLDSNQDFRLRRPALYPVELQGPMCFRLLNGDCRMNYSAASYGVSKLASYLSNNFNCRWWSRSYSAARSCCSTYRRTVSSLPCLPVVIPYRGDEVALRPKLPAPQLFLDPRHSPEYLPGRETLYRPNNLRRTVGRNRLHQKMHMISGCTWSRSVPISKNSISYRFAISKQMARSSWSTSRSKTTRRYFAGHTTW